MISLGPNLMSLSQVAELPTVGSNLELPTQRKGIELAVVSSATFPIH